MDVIGHALLSQVRGAWSIGVCMPIARHFLSVTLLVLACAAEGLSADKQITAQQAADHVGEEVEVCGVVASATYATRSRGQPTFLNLDRPYPNHIFTAIVWGSDRNRFGYAPESLQGKRICVTGFVTTYRNRPQIEVPDPSRIRVPRAKS